MSCAACQARVEKAVAKVPGVTSCAVSLLTNSMGVEGTAAPEEIVKAVEKAGYGASRKGGRANAKKSADTATGRANAQKSADAATGRADSYGNEDAGHQADVSDADSFAVYPDTMAEAEEALRDHETPVLKKRLITSLVFLFMLLYLSMGHGMLKWPVPPFLMNYVSLAMTEMLLSVLVMYINRKFFTSGLRALSDRSPNMDTLVALGSAAAFGYSLVELYVMILAMGRGDADTVARYGHQLYFESAAMIPTLITIGKMLEAMSKGRTTNALKSLMKLAPRTAVLYRDGKETEVPVGEVQIGDIFAVRPGEAIPADGIITEGSSAVDESALTGESIPADKTEGDLVSAATINQSGYIRVRATRVGEDTTLSQIIHMVSDAAATKAPIARVADQVSGVFVPAVIAVSAATLLIWLISGQTFTFAIARAIAVLVISCPCALGLATPVAIMVGSGMGAKNGILFKTAAAQEEAGKIAVVALDKTGTITNGTPRVTDILAVDGVTNDELLRLAADLEARSEHPLAKAVMERAAELGISADPVDEFQALPGNGLTAVKDGVTLLGGSGKFMEQQMPVPDQIRAAADKAAAEGKTPLYFAAGGQLFGMICAADTIKEDSAAAISELRNMGIEVVMLTGDNERTANAIGAEAGVNRVIAGVLPDGKEEVIRGLQKRGSTAMVGDGINDAPALTRADLGIAIGAGADVAIDAADIVLMKSSLRDVSAAIRLSRATLRNIHENLFWAFFYNVICIPLAAGFYSAVFGWHWEMSPMIGAAAMSISSFSVCMNALRLNLFDVHDTGNDRKHRIVWIEDDAEAAAAGNKENNLTKENEIMNETITKTLTVEGMMCGHCEATVKKALLGIPGVEAAEVSHEKGTAVVTMTENVADDVLKKAVEDKEYSVKEIR